MNTAEQFEQAKSLKVLYVVCNTDPTPDDWEGFSMSVSAVVEYIQDAIREADATGNFWASINAIKFEGRLYFDEACTQELTLSK